MPARSLIAISALLAGAAIVWAVAAGSGGSEPPRATSQEEREAVRIEARLAAEPGSRALLLRATEAWFEAGADHLRRRGGRSRPIPPAVAEDYEAGLKLWNRHLRSTRPRDIDPDMARQASEVQFNLVEIGSRRPAVVTGHAAGAVRAQGIVCRDDPNSLTLSSLAKHQYFNGENAAAFRSTQRALRYVRDAVKHVTRRVMKGYRERGGKFVARVREGMQTLRETGEEELAEPIKGYGAPAGLNGYEPGTEPS